MEGLGEEKQAGYTEVGLFKGYFTFFIEHIYIHIINHL